MGCAKMIITKLQGMMMTSDWRRPKRKRSASPDAEGVGENDVERELIGDDNQKRPTAEASNGTNGHVVAVKTKREPPEIATRERWDQAEELDANSEGGAESQPQKIVRTRECADRGRRVDKVKPDEHADADEVVGDRNPRSDPETVANIEQRRGDADDAVEEDLGHEPAQQ